MGTKTQNGFTIIEVLLFLSVTGLLAMGILVGSGVAIGQQRYRDSVNSLKSTIQQQYNEVANVINGRNQNWTCNTSGAISEVPSGGQPRGTSDCVVLGRFIAIDDSGKQVTVSNVVGYRLPGSPVASSDITELKNYKLSASTVDQDKQDVAWGAQVVKPKSTTPMPMSILVVRSPLSGRLLTFSTDHTEPDLNNLVLLENTSQPRDICVNADIGSFVGKRMEVRLSAYAANQGSVSIPPESESVCD